MDMAASSLALIYKALLQIDVNASKSPPGGPGGLDLFVAGSGSP